MGNLKPGEAHDLLETIESAGRIIGQVLDGTMSAEARAYALSRAFHALRGTYKTATGTSLKWWRYEAAIAKAEEVGA
jgi:hypothetical protein